MQGLSVMAFPIGSPVFYLVEFAEDDHQFRRIDKLELEHVLTTC